MPPTFRLPGLVRAHARERPHELALAMGDLRLTFEDVDERSNRCARHLESVGAGEGTRIAVLDTNSPHTVLLAFAAAKLGAVIVPLNWRLAPPELVGVLEDARAPVLFHGVQFADAAAEIASRLPTLRAVLRSDDQRLLQFPADDPGFSGDDETVIFQLYTSGTTGRPKGVLTTNGNFAALADQAPRAWSLNESSRSLVAMPLFHIGGLGWMLVGYSQGAANVLVAQIVPEQLLDAIVEERITNAFLVPTVLQMLCALPGAQDRDYSALRSIAYGASPITTTTLRTVIRTFGCELFQLYGLTETTGAVVQLDAADHDPDGPRAHLLRPAGRLYPWMEMKIVDIDSEEGSAVATGEVGEVWLRGSSVTPGYFGLPEETAAVLRADGWFRTGDGGYVDDDGYLFLTDRVKDMIVSGAENVYPIEVEEVLAQHPGVGEVSVVGLPDERWGETVTAVVVPRGAARLDSDELVAFARERLAGYKLPRRVFVVQELPKTASGKVLKRRLRDELG
jgi:acyl-CoA synthetase (AMP-forming)/AMP-acid ligase II